MDPGMVRNALFLPLLYLSYITDTALQLIPRFLHKETRHAKDVALAERTILLDAQNNTPTIQDLAQGRNPGAEDET
jgi:hypothetical protein